MLYSSSIDSPNLFVIEPSNPAYCSTEDLCQLIASSTQQLWKNLHDCGAVLFRKNHKDCSTSDYFSGRGFVKAKHGMRFLVQINLIS